MRKAYGRPHYTHISIKTNNRHYTLYMHLVTNVANVSILHLQVKLYESPGCHS